MMTLMISDAESREVPWMQRRQWLTDKLCEAGFSLAQEIVYHYDPVACATMLTQHMHREEKALA